PNPDESTTKTFAGKIGVRVDHADDWFSTVEFSGALDRQKNSRDGIAAHDDYETLRYGGFASTQKTIDVGPARHVFSGGLEAYEEHVDTNAVDFEIEERSLVGIFGQYGLEYDAFNLDAGIRYDHNEQFGDATTYNVGARYELL